MKTTDLLAILSLAVGAVCATGGQWLGVTICLLVSIGMLIVSNMTGRQVYEPMPEYEEEDK